MNRYKAVKISLVRLRFPHVVKFFILSIPYLLPCLLHLLCLSGTLSYRVDPNLFTYEYGCYPSSWKRRQRWAVALPLKRRETIERTAVASSAGACSGEQCV